MVQRARGAKADGAGLHGALSDGRHGLDIRRGRRLAIHPALTHHEDSEGRVRKLAGDIHVEVSLRQRVEVFGVGLPGPGQALGQHRERNVLDAFHQPDQPVVIFGLAGREADAAVAHHHGGDPMPGGRLHPSVPGGLAVIVGVDIDKPRGHHLSARVDLLGPRSRDPADRGDQPILDRDVRLERRRARSVDDSPAAHHQIERPFHVAVSRRSPDISRQPAPTGQDLRQNVHCGGSRKIDKMQLNFCFDERAIAR